MSRIFTGLSRWLQATTIIMCHNRWLFIKLGWGSEQLTNFRDRIHVVYSVLSIHTTSNPMYHNHWLYSGLSWASGQLAAPGITINLAAFLAPLGFQGKHQHHQGLQKLAVLQPRLGLKATTSTKHQQIAITCCFLSWSGHPYNYRTTNIRDHYNWLYYGLGMDFQTPSTNTKDHWLYSDCWVSGFQTITDIRFHCSLPILCRAGQGFQTTRDHNH